MQPQTFEILLEKLTYGGDAIGRLPDGRAVFIPFGLPGERVRVRLVEEKKNFAHGELLDVLEPSPGRISPKCKHFFSPLHDTVGVGDGQMEGPCGGCHYQHLPYESQLEAKTEILRDQLQRIGKIENPPVQPMVACPNPWNYRNHVQFHLTEDGKLGYVGVRFGDGLRPSPGKIVPIAECHLPEPSINELWPQLEFEPGAPFERVSLRTGVDDDLMLILESDELEAPELELEAGISVVHLTEEDALVMAGEDYLLMQVLDRSFHVSAGSFFQVTTIMAEKMIQHLLDRLPLPAKTLLDVYCGVGLFSAFLAPRCERLIGIESSPSACEDFAANLDEFDHVELYEGTAEDVIPHLNAEQPIVLVDPPRAGVDKRALDAIRQLAPQVIAYLSCDPSTLARDAARLIAGGYSLVDVTPFDLFPQTYHIESISIFAH
ncbi:MAG: class I SAM-dependent RNA methyltransferase [Anaerolineales bacterium]|nr:class I SAM-dependent RNA methyltransferase [Anaerolineales bacterium]